MVPDTLSLGDLSTQQISKIKIKKTKSYSPDMSLLLKIQDFDLEVKVLGHRPLSMGWDTSSLGDLPTYQTSKAHIKIQKSYNPDTSL